jgi:hypothetical protein
VVETVVKVVATVTVVTTAAKTVLSANTIPKHKSNNHSLNKSNSLHRITMQTWLSKG